MKTSTIAVGVAGGLLAYFLYKQKVTSQSRDSLTPMPKIYSKRSTGMKMDLANDMPAGGSVIPDGSGAGIDARLKGAKVQC